MIKMINLKISIQHNLNTENNKDPNKIKKFFIYFDFSSLLEVFIVNFSRPFSDVLINLFYS